MRKALFLLSTTILIFANNQAYSAETPATSKDGYNLFNPTPDKEMRSIAPDRPGKADGPYTLDAGHYMIETGIADYSRNRKNDASGNTLTQNTAFFTTEFRAGLTNNLEIQVIAEPQLMSRTNDYDAGSSSKQSGSGDVTTRFKYNFIGNDGGKFSFAAIPFIVLPTNQNHIESEGLQGGLETPFSYNITDDYTLGLALQYNRNENADNQAYHHEFVSTISINKSFNDKLSAYAEFYSLSSSERNSNRVSTIDFGGAYLPTPNIQLDAGINFGVTGAAAEYEPFCGISFRF